MKLLCGVCAFASRTCVCETGFVLGKEAQTEMEEEVLKVQYSYAQYIIIYIVCVI